MANTILVGAQWGDEGKGKIIDVLTEEADVVVRYAGGNNAGHTVWVGKERYILHLVPSGILRRDKLCVIGNGVVIDPVSLADEIRGLRQLGVKVGDNLRISETAHVVLPYHRELDVAREQRKDRQRIGTTKRGIGPAYADKAARVGLRMVDLIQPERFAEQLKQRIRENNQVLRAWGARPLSYRKVLEEYQAAGAFLKPFITNTVQVLHQALQQGKNLLFEGAQGTFLDIDHGTYPYVTSSNTTAGGACTGSGVPPNRIDQVVGVMKAYTTRVGEGPLPTEDAELGELLHGMGREFGATTGRPRRCGWFDAVAVRQAVLINGVDFLAVTNLDGLDTVQTIKVCLAYRVGRRRYDNLPSDTAELAACEPVYAEFPGWCTPTSGARRWKDLPARARSYLKALEDLVGAPIGIVSVGPDRDQTIFR
ncbi:adenylosuccinate synthase [Limisphaera ngatamarikiensis]|uniref:Adenylosuccinate synthetase n=1 Tax=Limisphaera ngatamarikiensis TaxID=1324935 RepID=A0A6M1RW35_9BACT|nr:adenylosuccinate synthase [Limisphaera ngatamarikiensis]NGO39591.1 adenylosuccinate synthase [Limisphaera ngatamarikiensis]